MPPKRKSNVGLWAFFSLIVNLVVPMLVVSALPFLANYLIWAYFLEIGIGIVIIAASGDNYELKDFGKGILIATIVIPLIGVGLCYAILFVAGGI